MRVVLCILKMLLLTCRRSKVDQERYFEDFPHPSLSVNNFTYVRRPLGLNNEAYEVVRTEVRSGLETRSEKRTRAAGKVDITASTYFWGGGGFFPLDLHPNLTRYENIM